jgi:hypothetical protein
MSGDPATSDPSTWDPAFDAVTAAPKNHKVVFENARLRVLEVTLESGEEEALHHHRWPSVSNRVGAALEASPKGSRDVTLVVF